jgi:hypothetical protein
MACWYGDNVKGGSVVLVGSFGGILSWGVGRGLIWGCGWGGCVCSFAGYECWCRWGGAGFAVDGVGGSCACSVACARISCNGIVTVSDVPY